MIKEIIQILIFLACGGILIGFLGFIEILPPLSGKHFSMENEREEARMEYFNILTISILVFVVGFGILCLI